MINSSFDLLSQSGRPRHLSLTPTRTLPKCKKVALYSDISVIFVPGSLHVQKETQSFCDRNIKT
jgi:hypothetical protein